MVTDGVRNKNNRIKITGQKNLLAAGFFKIIRKIITVLTYQSRSGISRLSFSEAAMAAYPLDGIEAVDWSTTSS